MDCSPRHATGSHENKPSYYTHRGATRNYIAAARQDPHLYHAYPHSACGNCHQGSSYKYGHTAYRHGYGK